MKISHIFDKNPKDCFWLVPFPDTRSKKNKVDQSDDTTGSSEELRCKHRAEKQFILGSKRSNFSFENARHA